MTCLRCPAGGRFAWVPTIPGALLTADLPAAIASAPMFDGLDRAHVEYLAAQSRPIVLPGGQVLFRRGTPSTGFYLVRDGRMQLWVSNSEGMVKVLEIIGPGGSFGHAVMFLRDPYPVDATALVDTHLVFVPAAAVDRILDGDPAMARLMLASMAKRLQAKVQDIAMLSLQSATQRIVAYLLGAIRDDVEDAARTGPSTRCAPTPTMPTRWATAPTTPTPASRTAWPSWPPVRPT